MYEPGSGAGTLACPSPSVVPFFAEGMLMTVAASLDLTDADIAWTVMCDGGPA